MTPEARAFLDKVDEFLSRCDLASAEVAAVLTANRSDDMGLEVKDLSTIPIRRAAFPKCTQLHDDAHKQVAVGTGSASRYMSFGEPGNRPHVKLLIEKPKYEYRMGHFQSHAVLAANVLDLEVIYLGGPSLNPVVANPVIP